MGTSRRYGWPHAIVIAFCLVAVGLVVILRSMASTSRLPVFDTTVSHVQEVSKVGRLAVPANIRGRDGGGSVVLGGKILWLYGDTFYAPDFSPNPPAPDVWRSATATYSDFSDPYNAVQGGVDSRGNPLQVIPSTPEEAEYNRVKNDPVNNRYVVWPSGQVAQDDNTALLFFMRFLTNADKSSATSGIGVATLRTGQAVATRQAGFLFGSDEPSFRVSMVHGDYVYLYAINCDTTTCPVARAPIAKATERSAYTFWDGNSWNMDVALAKPVMPVSNYGFTVMWSDALGKYIQAMIGDFSQQVYFSFSDAPQGPWSTPVKAFEVPGETTYVPYFHPELSQGQSVIMTYTRNNDSCKAPCTDTGGIEVMKITFAPSPQPNVGAPGLQSGGGTASNTSPQSDSVKIGPDGKSVRAATTNGSSDYMGVDKGPGELGSSNAVQTGIIDRLLRMLRKIWHVFVDMF